MFGALMVKYGCDFVLYLSAAYPAVYGQFPQAIPQPMSAVAPAQREGKDHAHRKNFLWLDIEPDS